jgi:hypothetical protein
MDEDILVIIVGGITVLGAMGGLLTGWWLWLRSRTERLRGGTTEDVRALQDTVARLRTEIETMYGELTQGQQELHERMDFAERLLAQGKSDRPTR